MIPKHFFNEYMTKNVLYHFIFLLLTTCKHQEQHKTNNRTKAKHMPTIQTFSFNIKHIFLTFQCDNRAVIRWNIINESRTGVISIIVHWSRADRILIVGVCYRCNDLTTLFKLISCDSCCWRVTCKYRSFAWNHVSLTHC